MFRHPLVDADAVSQRLRGSSPCCIRALPGTRCPHESNRHETGTCHVILLRPLGSSCSHQAAYVRHAVDAGSLCSIDSVSTSWPSLLSQSNFVVQRFPRQSLPYSCEERQVASARILVSQWRRRECVLGADSVVL